jgi:hypothetical protein
VTARREALRGALDVERRRLIVRAVDPLPDLAAALRAARPLGTFTRVRRSWRVEHGRLWLTFAMIDPAPTMPRAFELAAPELVDAFIAGCAVGLDVRPGIRAEAVGGYRWAVPLWPAEGPRLDMLDALADVLGAELREALRGALADDVERYERGA